MRRKIKTSEAVMSTETQRGIDGKMRHRPMAEPINSAMSVLTIAISEST